MIYAVFVVCLYVLDMAINTFGFFQLNEFERLTSKKLFRYVNSTAIALVYDGSNAWNLGSNLQFRFLKSATVHRWLGGIIVLFLLLPIFLLVGFVCSQVVSHAWIAICDTAGPVFGGTLGAISLLILCYPIAWIIAQFVPFKFTKNLSFIRWNFLAPIYRRKGMWPPLVDNWIKNTPA